MTKDTEKKIEMIAKILLTMDEKMNLIDRKVDIVAEFVGLTKEKKQ